MCHRVLSLCLLLRCHKVKLTYVCRWNGFFELLFQLYGIRTSCHSPLASVASSSHLCKLWVRAQLAVVVSSKQKLKIRDWCTGVGPHSSGLVHWGWSALQWIGALQSIHTPMDWCTGVDLHSQHCILAPASKGKACRKPVLGVWG